MTERMLGIHEYGQECTSFQVVMRSLPVYCEHLYGVAEAPSLLFWGITLFGRHVEFGIKK